MIRGIVEQGRGRFHGTVTTDHYYIPSSEHIRCCHHKTSVSLQPRYGSNIYLRVGRVWVEKMRSSSSFVRNISMVYRRLIFSRTPTSKYSPPSPQRSRSLGEKLLALYMVHHEKHDLAGRRQGTVALGHVGSILHSLGRPLVQSVLLVNS